MAGTPPSRARLTTRTGPFAGALSVARSGGAVTGSEGTKNYCFLQYCIPASGGGIEIAAGPTTKRPVTGRLASSYGDWNTGTARRLAYRSGISATTPTCRCSRRRARPAAVNRLRWWRRRRAGDANAWSSAWRGGDDTCAPPGARLCRFEPVPAVDGTQMIEGVLSHVNVLLSAPGSVRREHPPWSLGKFIRERPAPVGMIEIVLFNFNPSPVNVSACERCVSRRSEELHGCAAAPSLACVRLLTRPRRLGSLAGIRILKVLHDLWMESPR
jgi:hypothetical protein